MVGTLLLHALFIPALIASARLPGAAMYQYGAPDAETGSLWLLPTVRPATSDPLPTHGATPRNWDPPTLAIELAIGPPLHIESREPREVAGTPVDAAAFIKTCHELYPDERHFDRDLASVSLHGAHVDISDGDGQRALLALHCLQALGTVSVAAAGPGEAGR